MQKFHEFDILYVRKKDAVLEDLGLDNPDEYLDKGSFDLYQVESFIPCPDNFDGKELVKVELKSGNVFTVAISYNVFKALIKC